MKIAFYTLGCKVNQYETQALKEKFIELGYEIVGDLDYADIYVVNTCTVTGLSDRKSRQYIRRTKRINPKSITAVIGCYAQVSPEEAASIEGVNIVAGTDEKNRLPEFVREYLELHGGGQALASDQEEEGLARKEASLGPIRHIRDYAELGEYQDMGIITSMESRTRAFIKIQEGCNRFCSYCIIPYARGTLRSRSVESVAAEARSLLAAGFKELVLTGINTALYGMEPSFEGASGDVRGVEVAVRALNRLEGDFRIRLSSVEPTVVNAEYVKGLLKYEKLCRHLHLSLQSGSDRVLSAMNRRYSRQEYMDIVRELLAVDPNFGISTDIIVGFPGETEEDFAQTLDIVRQAGFCKVHAFKYSRRKGTRAAERKDQLSAQVKAERSRRLISLAEEEAARFFARNKGTTRRVLFEDRDEKTGMLRGHADNFIEVYCQGDSKLGNTFADVLLEEPFEGGMRGRLSGGNQDV